MVKLKKGKNIHATLQNAVIATINDPNYAFSLPKLSDWEAVVSSTSDEKQRLEFVGDAVMHLSIALYLYRLFPDGAPGLYTNIRSALNANATFTHLMVKAGAYQLPSQSHAIKAAADSFEVIVAALYFERGFADVCAWVQEQYAPLMDAARKSYDQCLLTSDSGSVPTLSRKRHMESFGSTSTPVLKKIRLSGGRSSPRSTLMAQRVINRMKSKGRVKLWLPIKKSKPPLERRLHSCKLRTPKHNRPSSLVIDLTMESDSDEEESVLSNAMRVPRSSVEQLDLSERRHSPLQSNDTSHSGQCSDRCTGFHWPPTQRSMTLRTQSRASSESHPPPALARVATTPGSPTSIARQAQLAFSRRSDLVSPQSESIDVPSGTCNNPIMIEDSEGEG